MVGRGAWVVGRRESTSGFGGHQDPREAILQTWELGYDVGGAGGDANVGAGEAREVVDGVKTVHGLPLPETLLSITLFSEQ